MAASLALCAAGPVIAASAPKNVVPEASKSVEGGLGVQVLVAQSEIKSNINPSYVSVAMAGGVLAALIDAKIESDRAKRAEMEIAPLRTALTGFDVDGLATDTTKATMARYPWLSVATPAFGRDSSLLGKSAALDAAATNEVAFFEYIYDLAPDFSTIRVSLNMQFANKALPEGKKPESRLAPRELSYSQTVTSVVALPRPTDMAGNAARWSAGDGKLARKALSEAFAELAILAPRALELSAADLKAMSGKDKKNTSLYGFSGRLLEEDDTGTLLFNAGLTHLETLSE